MKRLLRRLAEMLWPQQGTHHARRGRFTVDELNDLDRTDIPPFWQDPVKRPGQPGTAIPPSGDDA